MQLSIAFTFRKSATKKPSKTHKAIPKFAFPTISVCFFIQNAQPPFISSQDIFKKTTIRPDAHRNGRLYEQTASLTGRIYAGQGRRFAVSPARNAGQDSRSYHKTAESVAPTRQQLAADTVSPA